MYISNQSFLTTEELAAANLEYNTLETAMKGALKLISEKANTLATSRMLTISKEINDFIKENRVYTVERKMVPVKGAKYNLSDPEPPVMPDEEHYFVSIVTTEEGLPHSNLDYAKKAIKNSNTTFIPFRIINNVLIRASSGGTCLEFRDGTIISNHDINLLNNGIVPTVVTTNNRVW